jgi:hypothetical protein
MLLYDNHECHFVIIPTVQFSLYIKIEFFCLHSKHDLLIHSDRVSSIPRKMVNYMMTPLIQPSFKFITLRSHLST